MFVEKLNGIREAKRRIISYKNWIRVSACPIYKERLEEEIIKEIEIVLSIVKELHQEYEEPYIYHSARNSKEFTLKELSSYDGSDGKAALVAVNGIVYDVSLEPAWGGASHFGLVAGKDLSEQFNSCHAMTDILSRLKSVGVLKKEVLP